jgi:hypothetical protein
VPMHGMNYVCVIPSITCTKWLFVQDGHSVYVCEYVCVYVSVMEYYSFLFTDICVPLYMCVCVCAYERRVLSYIIRLVAAFPHQSKRKSRPSMLPRAVAKPRISVCVLLICAYQHVQTSQTSAQG